MSTREQDEAQRLRDLNDPDACDEIAAKLEHEAQWFRERAAALRDADAGVFR